MCVTTKKTFKKGFYGGKFLPFHTGHAWCIETALARCDELYVLLFVNTNEEKAIFETKNYRCPFEVLTPSYRINTMQSFVDRHPGVHLVVMDCNEIYRDESDRSPWEQEVPFVLKAVGEDFEVVFSSEPQYDSFFKTQYPWAEHVLIDPDRVLQRISGTEIREGDWTMNERFVL